MTLPETFEITLNTDQVVGALIIIAVTLAIPFVFGAITGKVEKGAEKKPLLERLGLAQVNPGIVLLGAVLWGLIFTHLYVGLIWMIWEVWTSDAPVTGPTGDWRFTLAKFTALTAVLGAVVAFPVTVVRLGLTRQQTRNAEDVLYNEKINEAARSLYATRTITKKVEDSEAGVIWRDMHEDDIVRRNAAIDALEELARERPAEAVRISRMLSVYVRELSREHPGEEVPEDLKPGELQDWARGLRPKRSDMYSAVLSLGRMRLRHAAQFAEERIDLRGANLQGMTLSADNLSFEGTLFERAAMQGADLTWAKLQGADLELADLRGADLSTAELKGANLSGAEMQEAELKAVKSEGANFYGAELQEANLTEATLQGADLHFAQLRGANLSGAELQGANLSLAKLQGADLHEVKFDAETDLLRTELDFACVRFVDFSEIDIDQDQIDSLFGDQTVTLPDWIIRPKHWEKIDEDDWDTFDTTWREWQDKYGFHLDDPATWTLEPSP